MPDSVHHDWQRCWRWVQLVSGQARLGRVEMVGEATGLKQGCQPVGFVVLAREDTENPRRCDSFPRV